MAKAHYVPYCYDSNGHWVPVEKLKCPYGERDTECYNGNKKEMCPFFIRYEWGKKEYAGCVLCTHEEVIKKPTQLEFDF